MLRVSHTLISKMAHGDPVAVRACRMSGATDAALRGQIKDLSKLVHSLDQAIREAEAAEKNVRFWGQMIAVAELVVAGCDLFMEIVAAGTPVGKGMKALYDQKQTLAEASVGKFDAAKASTRVIKGATNFMGKGAAVATKTLVSTADLAVDGARKQVTAKKAVLASIDKNLTVIEYAFRQEGKGKAADLVKNGKAVLKAGAKVFDTFSADNGVGGGSRTLIAQSKALKRRLQELNEQLVGCQELALP